jgi:glyoxylase-like metal-dependent hydrolase (beta-lactamase superfamily II)
MPDLEIIEYANQITCIDTHYQRSKLAACYLLESKGEAVFIDTGTSHTVPHLMCILAAKGIQASQVKYVIPTHVHLDHAGGAGALMRQLPNASLVIHPYGAKHMIDPSKLIAGATAVYGKEQFQQQFGQLTPIAEERVIEAPDETRVSFGNRELLILDTPGHARHHFCIYDAQSQGIFTGDTFGLSYREFDTEQGHFIMPTTTPVQFDPEAWQSTLTRLVSLSPKRIYLTHYGEIERPKEMAAKLSRYIDEFVTIAKASTATPGAERVLDIGNSLKDWVTDKLRTHGCHHSAEGIEQLMSMDLQLDAQGLDVWLTRLESI